MDSLFNDIILYDGEEYIKKDVFAYNIGKNIFNTESSEQKPIIYKEKINEEMDRQFEELQRQ